MAGKISLDYFYFEFPTDPAEQIGAAVEVLQSAEIRLRSVLDKLEQTAAPPLSDETIGHMMNDLQYHGETFLTSIYEFRERLLLLLAVLTSRDKAEFFGLGSFQRIKSAIAELRGTKPNVADDIRALLNQLESSKELRGTMTHEAFLHLSLLVDGYPHNPEDLLLQCERNETLWIKILHILREEITRFVSAREKDCRFIAQKVVSIATALGFPAVDYFEAIENPDRWLGTWPAAERLFKGEPDAAADGGRDTGSS